MWSQVGLKFQDSDGLITKCSNVGILLPLADCLGIVVFDEEYHVLGLLHSGRQNVEQYGPGKFIEYFVENCYNSETKQRLLATEEFFGGAVLVGESKDDGFFTFWQFEAGREHMR